MLKTGTFGLLLILVNVAVSFKGLSDKSFFNRYKFEVDKILINKDYKRLVTSGFMHVGWAHLIFNILSLYAFSAILEIALGAPKFLIIYFASLIGGNLIALLIYKKSGGYNVVGASAAVSGIIFSTIILYPNMDIGFFMLPFSIPSWLYGIVFVFYSIYGIHSKKANIGHEAHLSGALIGMCAALIIDPTAFQENYQTVLAIGLPIIILIFIIVKSPHALLIDNYLSQADRALFSIDQKYNYEKSINQKMIDKILDKINRKGIESLSQEEKEKLKLHN